MANDFFKMIDDSTKIAIFSHVNPDADALCSSIALKEIIRNNFEDKYVDVFTDGEIGTLYSPILRDNVVNPNPFTSYDLAVVLDCPSLSRIGKYQELASSIPHTVNIDHHGTNEKFADLNWVSTAVSSTSEFVYLLAKASDLQIDKDIAKLLYQGILTDTNCFTSNTMTEKTHRALSELLSFKFNSNRIKEYYFGNQSLGKAKLEAKALGTIRLHKNGTVAMVKITQNDLLKNGLTFEDTMGLVDKGMTIEGVSTSISLIEKQPQNIYASLRGKGADVDVSQIAKNFGGGGSPTVAAFQYEGEMKELEQKVLEYIKETTTEVVTDPDEKQLF